MGPLNLISSRARKIYWDIIHIFVVLTSDLTQIRPIIPRLSNIVQIFLKFTLKSNMTSRTSCTEIKTHKAGRIFLFDGTAEPLGKHCRTV